VRTRSPAQVSHSHRVNVSMPAWFKGTQPWERRVTKDPKEIRTPEGQYHELLRHSPPTPTRFNILNTSRVRGWARMIVRLPIVLPMAGLGIEIGTKKVTEGGDVRVRKRAQKTRSRAVYVFDPWAEGQSKPNQCSGELSTCHRWQTHRQRNRCVALSERHGHRGGPGRGGRTRKVPGGVVW
jgi:hypothetical protein